MSENKDPIRSAAAKKGWETRRARLEAGLGVVKLSISESKTGPEDNDLVNFIPYDGGKDRHFNEIYSSGMQYCWVTADWKACHSFVYCKDFLHDAIWSTITKQRTQIYGFEFSLDTNPAVNLNNLTVAVRNKKDEDFPQKWSKSIAFINEIEKLLGFTPSVFKKDKEGKVAIFIGDKAWLRAPQLTSMYLLLIRAGMNYDGSSWDKFLDNPVPYQSNDARYITNSKKGMLFLIEHGANKVFPGEIEDNYKKMPAYVPTIHNNSGIVTFTTAAKTSLSKSHPYIAMYPNS